MVRGIASMDACAILHMQKNCMCSCRYGCAYSSTPECKSSLAESRWSLAEYQGALGPISAAAVPTAGPAQAAGTAACPEAQLLGFTPHLPIPIKTSPKALLPDREVWKVCVCRILLPATGPGSQVIESRPDAEVWEIKHLGYIIMMKGHWGKLLVYSLLKPQFPLTFSEGKRRQQP